MTQHDDVSTDTDESAQDATQPDSRQPDARNWRGDGWTARIIKNEDDDGWAVEMTADGASEPSLVGPWTMGRDKKNPKPIDSSSFAVLVKAASEIVMRHEQQRRAALHRSVTVGSAEGRRRVDVDIVPDEDDPHAVLTVFDRNDVVLSRTRVAPDFKLSSASAARWLEENAAD